MKNNNILDERIDTGYRDLAGNIIYIGSTLSDPTHERIFDVFPGVVEVDHEGKLIIKYQSKVNKNCIVSRYLNKKVAEKSLVINEADHED